MESKGQLIDPDSGALSALIIIAAGIAVYANSLGGAFVFDDMVRIIGNRNIMHLWPSGHVLDGLGNPRPLVQLSLALNFALGGLDAWGYHALNLAVHVMAALALFGIVRRTLKLDQLRDRFGKVSTQLALAVSLVWTVHPLLTESVTYVIQRCESMMGLFYFLTLYCVIRGWQSPGQARWHGAAITCCALGMMCKEVMVTAPVAVLLYDYILLSCSFREIRRQRGTLYMGLASTWAILFFLLSRTSTFIDQEFSQLGLMTPWRYVLTQFGVIAHYLRLAVWPDKLVLDYGWPPATGAVEIAPYALLVSVLAAATLWGIFHRRAWGFVGAWFFLILAPSSSLVPLKDPAFEHRMYLPLAAIVSFLVIGGYAAGRKAVERTGIAGIKLARIFGIGLLILVATLLGCLTVIRNRDYQSEFSIWSDTAGKRPGNARAHTNLGVALKKLGRLQEAVEQYQLSLVLQPGDYETHNNLGNVLMDLGNNEEALAHYREALRIKPDDAEAHNNLGAFFLDKQDNPKEAVPYFEESLRLKPDYPQTHHNLGIAFYRLGRYEEAAKHFQEVLRLDPGNAEDNNSLGVALSRLGRFDEAVRHFREALRLQPGLVKAKMNLDRLLMIMEKRKSEVRR